MIIERDTVHKRTLNIWMDRKETPKMLFIAENNTVSIEWAPFNSPILNFNS